MRHTVFRLVAPHLPPATLHHIANNSRIIDSARADARYVLNPKP